MKRLLDSMQTSQNRSDKTQSTLSSLSRKLTSIETSLASMSKESSQSALKLSQIKSQTDLLVEFANRKDWISSFSGAFAPVIVALLLLNNWTIGRRLNQQVEIVRQQDKQISWLLEKANRQECFLGVKPPSDPQCRQYQ